MDKRIVAINFFGFIFFLGDRFFKYLFLQNPRLSWNFIFSWRLSKNQGIAFNIPMPAPAIIIVSIGVIFILVSFLIQGYKKRNIFQIAFLTLIVFGAFSNLLDRLQQGFVIDYIDVPYFTVLNLADVMITVGVGFILIKEIFFKKKNVQNNKTLIPDS